MPKIGFAIQSYRHPSLPISAQSCVNMYAEAEPKDAAKDTIVVLDHPGLVQFVQLGAGPIRGMRVLNGTLYVVSGGNLYKVLSTGATSIVGGTVAGVGPVSISDNGAAGGQLIIVNGAQGYVYSVAAGFQSIASANFFPANTVTFFDNYFVLDKVGTNNYFLSNLLDGLTYTATNIASADGQQGNVVTMVNQQNTLYIFGESHMEAWYDAGNASFPFLRYDGATIERGCTGARSVVKEDNAVFFLGNDLVYYRIDNGKPVRVSTHAIEAEWTKYTVVRDIITFSYTYNGHKFVVLTFPSQGATWVYDISTNLWHERVSWDVNNNSLGQWRVSSTVQAYGKQFFGDYFTGQIGYLDPNVATEYGNTVPCTLVGPPIFDKDQYKLFFDMFSIDMEFGVGTVSGVDNNPQIVMDYSDDGGRTFTVPIAPRGMGVLGDYVRRAFWKRMGQSRQRVYRVRMTNNVRRRVITAYATIRKGRF